MAFFIAENIDFGFKISGVLALVALSLFMAAFGRTRISHETGHVVKEFWHFIVFTSETIIFILGGILIAIKVFKAESNIQTIDIYKTVGIWVCLIIGRLLSILFFMPFLGKQGYGLNMKEVLVLTYGGLRGGINVAFALIVAKDRFLNEKLKDIILLHIAGVAILTLTVNAMTLKLFIRVLKMNPSTYFKDKFFKFKLNKIISKIE